MKKILYWLNAALLVSAMACVSCSDDNNDNNNSGGQSQTDRQLIDSLLEQEWVKCAEPTFIASGCFDGEDEDFQKAVRHRFPNQVGSPAQAEVAFTTLDWLHAHEDEMEALYDRGGLVVLIRPQESLRAFMANLSEGMEDFIFSDNEQLDELFYAFNNRNRYYTMYEVEEFDGNYTDDIKEMSAEEEEAIRAYHEAHPDEDEDDGEAPLCLYDNDYEQDYEYFQTRLNAFVSFVNETAADTRSMSTRSDDPADLKLDPANDGYRIEKDFPIDLDHKIDDDYCWNKHSSVSVVFWVEPTYMLSCNGDNKAGDYYLVRSEVTPHNTPLWEVGSKKGGLFNWGRCRIYAYWLDKMDVKYELLDSKGNAVSNLQYYQRPVPDPENTEGSQTHGFTWGLNGSISGEGGKEGGKGSASVGFSLEWSHETTFNYKSLSFLRDLSTKAPLYTYFTNVTLTDLDYEDVTKTNGSFPIISHSDFTVTSAWIWRVPRKTNGVDDNSTTSFKLKVSVKPVYASWYHWRAAVEYDSNKETYNGYIKSSDGWFTHTEDIPAPDRTPWGVVALKNAANITVANIKIYNQEDFTAKGTDASVYATIPSSYNVNEIAKANLPEGKYALVYETIDPNAGNKLTGVWKYENIEIHQGQKPSDATTEISTVNASQIK